MRNLSTRSEEVLSSIISEFISSGRAVGSQTIADRLDCRFSSATIRNVMAELEKTGLLTHAHTSSGRLPTEPGMRYYVDQLLKIEPASEKIKDEIRGRYKDTSYSVSEIFLKTSKILSGLSNYAGLVVAPRMAQIVIKQVEFIMLSNGRVLGIFVGRDGLVENRIIKIKGEYNYLELEKMTNYCNRVFYGLTLGDALAKIENELAAMQKELDKLISKALFLSKEMFTSMEKSDLFIEGGAQLLGVPDFNNGEKVAELMEALGAKESLIELLGNTMQSDAVNIFIGSESGYDAFENCSLISASYKKGDQVLGTLGVIGPKRMDYSKVIPIVDCTANLIGNFLNGEEIYDS